MSKDKDNRDNRESWWSKPWTPLGTSEAGRELEANLKTSATLGAAALLFGLLHRSWGSGMSEQSRKVSKNIPHTVTLRNAPLSRKKASAHNVFRYALPALVITSGYYAGVQGADYIRKKTQHAAADRELDVAERRYNEVLMSRLYPDAYAKMVKERDDKRWPNRIKRMFRKDNPEDNPEDAGAESPELESKEAAETFTNIFLGASGLVAAASFTLAYLGSKRWSDVHDKNRNEARELRSALDTRAMKRWMPKLVISDSLLQEELDKDREKRTGIVRQKVDQK